MGEIPLSVKMSTVSGTALCAVMGEDMRNCLWGLLALFLFASPVAAGGRVPVVRLPGDGVAHGAAIAAAPDGVEKSAYSFDGRDDWVEVTPSLCEVLDFRRDWSMEFNALFEKKAGYAVFVAGADQDSGGRQFVVSSRFVKLSAAADSAADWRVNYPEPSAGEWHHYRIDWEKAGRLSVQIDGVPQGEDTSGTLADFCPQNVPVIGAVHFQGVKVNFWQGRLAGFRIFDNVPVAATER